MLTGSGVALILRVVGTPPDDPWNTYAWWVFAVVAAFALLTKYVIKYRGTHVFNPSNIGLVVAFLVLGSTRIEPLDFWWAPLQRLDDHRLRGDHRRRAADHPAAHAARAGGHVLGLARRSASGCSPASGHCMIANWAFTPVCGVDFWRVIVTSPEVLIFLFFMITDPKTTPAGRVGPGGLRLPRGRDEHAADGAPDRRVGDEGRPARRPRGRVRGPADPRPPRARAEVDLGRDRPVRAARGPRRQRRGSSAALRRGRAHARAGAGARRRDRRRRDAGARDGCRATRPRCSTASRTRSTRRRCPRSPSARTSPTGTTRSAGPAPTTIVLTLAQNLELENQALLRRDPTILAAVDHGDRLDEMQARLADAAATGTTTVDRYRFDTIDDAADRAVRRADRPQPRASTARAR